MRAAIIQMALEQTSTGNGQPHAQDIVKALKYPRGAVGNVLREADRAGLLQRRCTYKWSDGSRCGRELLGDQLGYVQRTLCGQHYERNGRKVVEEKPTLRTAPKPALAPVVELVPEVVQPEPEETVTMLSTVVVDGDQLEVLTLDDTGWVTLRSLFGPFGKRVDEQVERLRGWVLPEDLRKVLLPARPGSTDSRGKVGWIIAEKLVLGAIAELDSRGMPDALRTKHASYKRTCAAALNAYFSGVTSSQAMVSRPTESPRLVDNDDLEALIQKKVDESRLAHRIGAGDKIKGWIEKLVDARVKTLLAQPREGYIEADPTLFQLKEIRREALARGMNISLDRISKIGVALKLIGDGKYGAIHEAKSPSGGEWYTHTFGVNYDGREAILEAVKTIPPRGNFESFLDGLVPVGAGDWDRWQKTFSKRPLRAVRST